MTLLSHKYPNLAEEFDKELNAGMSLDDFTFGSAKKVWWQCAKDESHTWEAAINKRTKAARGCPYCSGRLASPGRNLLDCYPEIAKDLHPSLNGDINPSTIPPSSGKKLWWQCPKHKQHVYEALVAGRTSRNSGCPYCAGHKVDSTNSLASCFPLVAKTWCHEKNGSITPSDITWGSRKKFWWICEEDQRHIFVSSVVSRTSRGSGCPICLNQTLSEHNTLGGLYPDIAESWHPSLNGIITPSDVIAGSKKKYWWQCRFGHAWKAATYNRIRGSNCPKCSNQTSALEIRVYCVLKRLFNGVVWREKIKNIEADVLVRSLRLVVEIDGSYWHKLKDEKDKEKTQFFESRGYKVLRLREIPLKKLSNFDVKYKTNDNHRKILNALVLSIERLFEKRDVVNVCKDFLNKGDLADEDYNFMLSALPSPPKELSLSAFNPEAIKVWDYDKNYPLLPEMFYPSSNREVNWRCERGHSWQKSIDAWNRVNSRCPACDMEDNNLAAWFPDVARCWHPTKNGSLSPEQVTKSSHQSVWWKCENEHSYKSTVAKASMGRCCPYCSGKKAGYGNTLADKYPEIAREWHETKNNGKVPEDFTFGSAKSAWWLCNKGHEYQMPIKRRTTNKAGCSYCAGKLVRKDASFGYQKPELISQWDNARNSPLTPFDVMKQSGKVVWWICENNHSFQQRVIDRYRGILCKKCKEIQLKDGNEKSGTE